jgi:hypothetical protein
VQAFQLVTGSGSPQNDVRELLLTKLIPRELVQIVLDQALGWVKRQTDLLLEQGKPAFIKFDDFHADLTAFVTKCTTRRILSSVAANPTSKTV